MSQPTFLLAPKLSFKPTDAALQLGNIVSDPLRPHRILTSVDAVAFTDRSRYPPIETSADISRSITRGKGTDVSVAVWARFVEFLTAGVSGNTATHVSATYSADSLVTERFARDPGPEEIAVRVSEPRVRSILRGNYFSRPRPVYMITGRIIAKGLEVSSEAAQMTSASVDAEAEVTGAAGVSLGAQLGGGVNNERRDDWTAGEDRVFAYELLKIEFKGFMKRRISVDEFVPRDALLSHERPRDDDEDEGDDDGADEGDNDSAAILPTDFTTTAVDIKDIGVEPTCVDEVDGVATVILPPGTDEVN
ncbi:hypothetical protein QBC42DRAFT_297692 [Cladorrhinum samala]|uniref:Uncharacterized protein n=1 Tax=Cladorrhinum samala TaxID=585594 RepID=A0AAV9HLJ5_9PEZI|nr:hypothetical protein QBC42DRAFT_297692 [Cladorrhinum samala]